MELVYPFSKIEPVSIFFKQPQHLIDALLSLPTGIARSQWPPTTTTTTTTTATADTTTSLFQETFSDEFAKMIDVSKSTVGFVHETFDPENIFVEMHYRILKKKVSLLENLRCLMPTVSDADVEAQLHTILMDGVTEVRYIQ